MKVFGIKIKHVVLNQKNTHAQRKQENQTGQGQMAGGGGGMRNCQIRKEYYLKKGLYKKLYTI